MNEFKTLKDFEHSCKNCVYNKKLKKGIEELNGKPPKEEATVGVIDLRLEAIKDFKSKKPIIGSVFVKELLTMGLSSEDGKISLTEELIKKIQNEYIKWKFNIEEKDLK